MPAPHIHRPMNLGEPPRIDWNEPDLRGVRAAGSGMTPVRNPSGQTTVQGSNPYIRRIPVAAQQHWYADISDKVGTGQSGAPQVPQLTVPRYRLGPIPKLATGTGRTARHEAHALGYTPTAFASDQYIQAGVGMGQMPARRESFDGTMGQGVGQKRPVYWGLSGYPQQGVAAENGRASMSPTYQPHDFAAGYFFSRHGRQPGTWQETAYGPEYRNLKATQIPEVYNMGRTLAVHMARPLSQNVYFLAYQTPASVAGRIGASGMNVPTLGYSGG